jgi:glycine/D-amino acid oxidase-like deaminating enzyme
MPKIVVVGGGVIGLCTGMLLAQDGNEVTLVERDPAPPPSPEEAWSKWNRTGVNQFRMLHYFQPRFREIVEAGRRRRTANQPDRGVPRRADGRIPRRR